MAGRERTWRIAAGAGGLAAALAGCSSAGGQQGGHSTAAGAPKADSGAVRSDALTAGAPQREVQRAPARDSRSIVYKGEITVRARDIAGKAAQAAGIATAA